MFDIGFSELMVIGVVALIVIGPERLPKVARTVGILFGRMQRYVNDVKADISREMQLEELRKLQASMQDAARDFETSVTREVNATQSELQKIAQEANPTPLPAPAESAPLPEGSTSGEAPLAGQTAATAEAPAVGEAAPADHLTAAEASAQLELDISSPAPNVEKRA
jgi:sec-independent protein translocase protein TatB